jgi:hypothetical protein
LKKKDELKRKRQQSAEKQKRQLEAKKKADELKAQKRAEKADARAKRAASRSPSDEENTGQPARKRARIASGRNLGPDLCQESPDSSVASP